MILAASVTRTRAGIKAAAGTFRVKPDTVVAVISARATSMAATAMPLAAVGVSRLVAAVTRRSILAAIDLSPSVSITIAAASRAIMGTPNWRAMAAARLVNIKLAVIAEANAIMA